MARARFMTSYMLVLNNTADPSADIGVAHDWIRIDDGWQLVTSQFEMMTSNLREGILTIKLPVIQSYTNIYDLCLQGHLFSKEIYSRIEPLLNDWLRNDLWPRCQWREPLTQFSRMYLEFKIVRKYLCAVFKYLDHFHVRREGCLAVSELCTSNFFEVIFCTVMPALSNAIQAEVERFRTDCIPQKREYDGNIDLLLTIHEALLEFHPEPQTSASLRDSFLEQPLLQSTKRFYNPDFTNDLLSNCGCSQYLQRVSQIISAEIFFFSSWLDSQEISHIESCLQCNLLSRTFKLIANDEHEGFEVMLSNRLLSDLTLMYSLFQYEPTSLESLAALYQNHVSKKGKLLDNSSVQIVPHLISLWNSEFAVIQDAFQNSIRFHRALHDAFELVLECSNSAHHIASYLGNLLSNQNTTETLLADALPLVACLRQDKDIFSLHYRHGLAQRLLRHSSDPHPGDRTVVKQLHAMFGVGFSHQMEVMLKDIEEQAPVTAIIGAIKFSLRVLTISAWPKFIVDTEKEMILPNAIYRGLSALEESYKRFSVGRKITWAHAASDCIIHGKCFRSRPDIHLSGAQGSILLIFNKFERVIVKDMASMTGLSLPMTKRALRHMCTGKYNILLKEPAHGYSSNDILSVNIKFFSDENQFRVPLGAEPSIDQQSLRKSLAVIKEDRRHILEAAMVRVVKQSKNILSGDLKTAVIDQIKASFQLDPVMLSDLIADLITREYFFRDPSNPDMLRYNPD